jgi:CRP-like cAMP-binding protein
VGIAEDHGFRLPLTQSEIGDALGLSTVHVNRSIQQLRKKGLIVSKGRFLCIRDWEGLKQAGEFDPTYLHLNSQHLE